MHIDDLKRRYEYGFWANRKLFDVIAQLTPEEFTRNVAGSYGSVRNTLVHLMSTEWGWVARCGGHPRGDALKAVDYATKESVIDQWSRVEGYVRDFLATMTDQDLNAPIEFEVPSTGKRAMPRGELLEHGVNHGVHHRGQIGLLLRALGHVPGNFDVLFYDIANRAVGTS